MTIGRPRKYEQSVEEVKAKYEQGFTIREVSELTGIDRATVHRMLKRAGVSLRNRKSGV